MSDVLPAEMGRWQEIERTARLVFGLHGYQEVRTPVVEQAALYARGVGESTDIVKKEMYTFPDRKGRSLTLRPEATAAVVRAGLENNLIGADNLREFRSWKEPGEIVKRARLIVMNRPGFAAPGDDPALPKDSVQCLVPSIDISATEIRRRVQKGLTISYLVPASVARYIDRHRLYRQE